MIRTDSKELAIYTTAGELAQCFEKNVNRIADIIHEIGERCDELSKTFDDRYGFSVGMRFRHDSFDCNPKSAEWIVREMRKSVLAAQRVDGSLPGVA